MTTLTDLAPFFGSVGSGFFGGMLAGYAIKKVIRIAAVIVGLFIGALAYLEYQKIISVDWVRVQSVSQSGITWVADSLTHTILALPSLEHQIWDSLILFH